MAKNNESGFFLQTSLLSAMLGVSIGFAIQEGVSRPSALKILALTVVILHAANFYHGKLIGLYDLNESIRNDARPVFRAALLPFNVLLFLTFCIMAIRVDSPWAIARSEVVLRVIDSAGILAQLRVGDRSPGKRRASDATVRQLTYWLWMNGVCALVFGALLLWPVLFSPKLFYPVVVVTLTVLVAIDLLLEYFVYSANYFESLGDWQALAERWDRLQGENGDEFRRHVIHPFVAAQVMADRATTVVDLGCGNGCTLRYLGAAGNLRLIGVDSSPGLVELAGLYEEKTPLGLTYATVAVDAASTVDEISAILADAGAATERVMFVALFSAQDCADLPRFFDNISRLAKPGESLLLVFESETSFDPSTSHTTTVRTWKYSLRSSERRQVVSWLPVESTSPTSVFAGTIERDETVISLVTHFRTDADYVAQGRSVGFSAVHGDYLLPTQPWSSMAERRYLAAPRFRYLLLRRDPGQVG